jgi:hypothetical protein
MTPQEFKAWFEGFTEAFDRLPTKAQWARVKERVAEIDGKPVTERIYLDRYLHYPTYPRPYWWGGLGASGGAGCGSTTTYCASNSTSQPAAAYSAAGFNSATAMAALGRADAQALAA